MYNVKKPTVYADVVHEHKARHSIPGRRFVHVVRTLIVVGSYDDLGRHDVTRHFPVTRLIVCYRVLRFKVVLNATVVTQINSVLSATVRVEWFVVDGVIGAVHAGGVEDDGEVDHLDGRAGTATRPHPQRVVVLQPETRLRALP